MFKEDIKIKILDEGHFNKVKGILVKEGYFFSCGIRYPVDYLFVYKEEVTWGYTFTQFNEHKNKEYILWGSNKLVPKVGVTLPKPVESNKILTPCERLGYKVGDKFIVLKTTGGFTKGQVVHLYRDDHTDKPPFKGSNTNFTFCGDDEEGAFLGLEYVELIKESNTNREEKKMMGQTTKSSESKNKPKTQAQLVFTYTNGKNYVVRGLQQAFVEAANGAVLVTYTHQTKNDVKTQSSTVVVKVTNELVKVEKINTDNSVEVVLDLSSNSGKAVEVVGSTHEQSSRHSRKGAKKPRGNARSKEEYEAMLEAKKATDERNKALVEAKARELAAKMFKEGKI